MSIGREWGIAPGKEAEMRGPRRALMLLKEIVETGRVIAGASLSEVLR
jgi:hypothetical protein